MLIFVKLFCLLFLSVFLLECYAKNYCSPDTCNNSKQHTLCRFQSDEPARHCIDYVKTIRTSKQKHDILDKLNNRRNKVAGGEIKSLPPAENMMKLEWNEELEKSAQRWANQCVRHSVPDIKDTCRDLEQWSVGQNIATIYGDAPGLTPLALVDVWYMELLNINASILEQHQPSVETGYPHYDYFTQLVWAESGLVGCGGVKFKERVQNLSNEINRTIYRLVCNFAPSGNRMNRAVYTEGPPCSQCPKDYYCDFEYLALCSTNKSHGSTQLASAKKTEPSGIVSFDVTNIKIDVTEPYLPLQDVVKSDSVEALSTSNSDKEEDNLTPFDYFSHLHEFTQQLLSTTTETVMPCKDVLAVDDFVELLKKKLSADPMLKDLLHTTKMPDQNGNTDGTYTDASVAAFVSRIYSKKVPFTTTKLPGSDYLNSTLLVDLVEAVIFRSGDRVKGSEEIEQNTQSILDVSPIKIQAELAEIRPNYYFTGHYFFPEDDDNDDETTSETTESYYDNTNIPVSDIVMEIEDLKRNKATNDFLDDILESESATENIDKNDIGNEKRKCFKHIWKNLKENHFKKRKRRDYLSSMSNFENRKIIEDSNLMTCIAIKVNDRYLVMKYIDLLKTLASDFKILKLNERFHCSRNGSIKLSLAIILNVYIYLSYRFLI